jgi:uncharacterized membrane protein YeaQ/YmgE (transglycosylase-associated protein family)
MRRLPLGKIGKQEPRNALGNALYAGRNRTMLGLIIYLLVIGIIAGYLARLLVPGKDPMGFWGTVLLGIVGSFVGGFLGYAIFGEDLDQGALQASGIIGSIIGAIIALLVWRAVGGRGRAAVTR